MSHPPDLPDPDWKPAYPPKVHDGLPVLEAPPMVPQRLRDRASGILPSERDSAWRRWFARNQAPAPDDDFWFVFQPVTQLLVILPNGLAVVECSADAKGRHTALLYNPVRSEGHVLYGSTRVELFRA
jgi:hypothetical protein